MHTSQLHTQSLYVFDDDVDENIVAKSSLTHDVDAAQTEITNLKSIIAEKASQITVLMETIEALQSSSSSSSNDLDAILNGKHESMQGKMMMFAAQLTASKTIEAQMDRQCKKMMKEQVHYNVNMKALSDQVTNLTSNPSSSLVFTSKPVD